VSKADIKHIPIEYLQRGRYQPRREFDESALQELASSIKAQGLIQPIVVLLLWRCFSNIIAEKH